MLNPLRPYDQITPEDTHEVCQGSQGQLHQSVILVPGTKQKLDG